MKKKQGLHKPAVRLHGNLRHLREQVGAAPGGLLLELPHRSSQERNTLANRTVKGPALGESGVVSHLFSLVPLQSAHGRALQELPSSWGPLSPVKALGLRRLRARYLNQGASLRANHGVLALVEPLDPQDHPEGGFCEDSLNRRFGSLVQALHGAGFPKDERCRYYGGFSGNRRYGPHRGAQVYQLDTPYKDGAHGAVRRGRYDDLLLPFHRRRCVLQPDLRVSGESEGLGGEVS